MYLGVNQLHICRLVILRMQKISTQRMTVIHAQRENILILQAPRLKLPVKIAQEIHMLMKAVLHVHLAVVVSFTIPNAQDAWNAFFSIVIVASP